MKRNLIPDKINPSPDYYCTWQTQQYATNNGGVVKQREAIAEEYLFGNKPGQGWADFYEDARKDLFFLMDDSWDVPMQGYEPYYGSLILNSEKFPEACENATPEGALKKLTERFKEKGWKGLGGWVCAQESEIFLNGRTPEEYWKERILWSRNSGFAYWKIDWGKRMEEPEFRNMITELAHKYAPGLWIEQAMIKDIIPCSDTFRTYDVAAIMSIPMTMEKTADCLNYETQEGYGGIINCEDEVYLAAALGCAMGVERHPMSGALVNGKPDPTFPQMHRNIKTKLAEVLRAVHWHRIAPAFGVCKSQTRISEERLTDDWTIENQAAEYEEWWGYKDGDTVVKSGPAAIARGLELPEITPDEAGEIPYVAAAKNPEGPVSIVTMGRTKGREYFVPRADVRLQTGDSTMFGIFGYYKNLTLQTSLDCSEKRILAQDLAGEEAIDITEKVVINGNEITLPGRVLEEIGTSAQKEGDTSEPGLVLVIE